MSDQYLDTRSEPESPYSTDSEIDDDSTKISPMRGRSVKEYDEQFTALKKENFNLKLRIYFLEERMGPNFRFEDKDSIMRKNIEYQVDIETLRKELDEKQDLLCQAVKALELEDAEHKKTLTARDSEISDLNTRIESLEHELKSVINTNAELTERNERLIEDSSHFYSENYGLESGSVKEQLTLMRNKIADLEYQLSEEKETNSLLENDARDLECLQLRCANLENELEDKNKKIEALSTEIESNGHIISSCNLRIRTLEDILTAKSSDNKFKEKEIIHRDRIIQDQAMELDELRRLVENGNIICDKEQRQTENLKSAVMSRDNTIADLESKLEKCKAVIRNLEDKLQSFSHENKRQKDEIETMKSQRRVSENKYKYADSLPRSAGSPRSSSSSRGSPSSSLSDPLEVGKDPKTVKLEEENKKAYTLIQTLVAHSKNLEKLKAEQEAALAEKDQEILQLRKEQYLLINPVQNSSLLSDKENSTEDVENNVPSDSNLDVTTLEWAKQLESLMEVIQEKEEELQKMREKSDKTTTVLEQRDNRITELEKEISDLRSELTSAHKKIDELQTEKQELSEKPDSLIRITEEKDKKIEQLENEVRKHTFNLQGIVNNELWDKNREIEKLQNRFTEKLKVKEHEMSELEKQITAKDLQLKILKDKISELGIQINLPSSLFMSKVNISEIDANIPEENSLLKEQLRTSNEECKYLHKAVEELRQQLRNTPERDDDNKLAHLKEEYLRIQDDLQRSEKMRLDTVNLCSLLTTRLEELAHFLDSLLKHKSVLGMLGSKQRSAIKQAIDQSLDLSKSLSVSMMNEDQSLAQLSSITGFLNTSANSCLFDSWREDEESKNNVSLTFNSHLNRQRGDGLHNNVVIEQAEIITILRAQIETMKKEIELRDMEICKQIADQAVSSDAQENLLKNDNDLVEAIIDLQNKSPLQAKPEILSTDKIFHNLVANKSYPILKSLSVENHSESEAWSEPDRCVSQARIGLDSEALKSTSSASNLNRSRSNKSTSESTEEETSTNNKTPSKRGSSSVEMRNNMLQENLGALENKLKEKENEILSLRGSILELDNKSLELKLNMTEEIAKLRNEKIDVEKLLKETEEKIKNLDLSNEEILSKISNVEGEKNAAIEAAHKAIAQSELFKAKALEMENRLRENQLEYQSKIKDINENWKSLIQEIESEKEFKLKELKTHYETNWIQKREVHQELAKLTQLSQELDVMKELLKTSENKIMTLEKSELEWKKKLSESEESYRDKIVALKRELNESTLCASQTALERTKISNEKLKLESEIRKLESREVLKCNELEEKEKELINLKNTLQKQIAVTEQQKSCLELKVSELESANAELHNRLVKIQTKENWAPCLSNGSPKLSELVSNFKVFGKHSLSAQFMRQKSDMSGYASEDVFTDENDGGMFNRSVPHAFHWFNQANVNNITPEVAVDARNVANSSPDLGIESDQGRFSSLETNITTTRPLLQTLELTASMNNLLSNDHLDSAGHYCNIPQHKVMEKENLELKQTVSKLEVGLEKTMSELSKINKTKKQVEKGICKQIHKTSLVLRQARANLDSGSENENKRK